MPIRFGRILLLFALFHFSQSGFSQTSAKDLKIDFRYSPPSWETLIVMPDDWQKTVVNDQGTVLLDYPGPYLKFGTTISMETDSTLLVRTQQQLHGPKVPLVVTERKGGGITLREEVFSIISEPYRPMDPKRPENKLQRLDPLSVAIAWTKPAAGVDPAFADSATATERAIHYTFAVEQGGARRIVLGLSEGYWEKSDQRIQDLVIEGAPIETVDLLKLGKINDAHVFIFDAKDSNQDGKIDIEVRPSRNTKDRNTLLNVLWVFKAGTQLSKSDLIAGRENTKAELYWGCGLEPDIFTHAPRKMVLSSDFTSTNSSKNFRPVLKINSKFSLSFDAKSGLVSAKGQPFLVTRPNAAQVVKTATGLELIFTNKVRHVDTLIIQGFDLPNEMPVMGDLVLEKQRAIDYWTTSALPSNQIQVPDVGIQALLDSSIRNIYQARELRGGVPEYRVGPTVYRSIFVVDGAFIFEVATWLGDIVNVRKAIDHIMDHQQASGQVVVMNSSYLKETGIMLWAIYRHAQLTQDKQWLKLQWPKIQKAVSWIAETRKATTYDPNLLYAGLMPPGYSDGGIDGVKAEYTNTYWSLSGLNAAISAAEWLGEKSDLVNWKSEYADFQSNFQKAALRDRQKANDGSYYLPILMEYDPAKHLPQKAQWAFCQAVFPGKIFSAKDPLVSGTLSMLDSFNVQGLVLSTGWIDQGLWTYFGSFYGHAHLWQGNFEKAQDTLYAFGNHASPLLAWREEQLPLGEGDHVVGDMPHNWASAEFIRLTRNLIALERGNDIHFLQAVPESWLIADGVADREIGLKQMASEFGMLNFSLKIAKDGKEAVLNLSALGSRGNPGNPVIHLTGLRRLGFKDEKGKALPDTVRAAWGQDLALKFIK